MRARGDAREVPAQERPLESLYTEETTLEEKGGRDLKMFGKDLNMGFTHLTFAQ